MFLEEREQEMAWAQGLVIQMCPWLCLLLDLQLLEIVDAGIIYLPYSCNWAMIFLNRSQGGFAKLELKIALGIRICSHFKSYCKEAIIVIHSMMETMVRWRCRIVFEAVQKDLAHLLPLKLESDKRAPPPPHSYGRLCGPGWVDLRRVRLNLLGSFWKQVGFLLGGFNLLITLGQPNHFFIWLDPFATPTPDLRPVPIWFSVRESCLQHVNSLSDSHLLWNQQRQILISTTLSFTHLE